MKNKKKTFIIPVYWRERGTVEVEATDLDEAIEIVDTDDFFELPDGEYVDNSWEVDVHGAYAMN